MEPGRPECSLPSRAACARRERSNSRHSVMRFAPFVARAYGVLAPNDLATEILGAKRISCQTTAREKARAYRPCGPRNNPAKLLSHEPVGPGDANSRGAPRSDKSLRYLSGSYRRCLKSLDLHIAALYYDTIAVELDEHMI